MDLKNKIIVITGAANGIGRAMAIRFTAQGAKKIICADLDEDGVYETAEQVGGIAHKIDVSREADISTLIEITETEYTTRLTNNESVYIACFVGCTYHCG